MPTDIEDERVKLKEKSDRIRMQNGIIGAPFMIGCGLGVYGYYAEEDLNPPLDILQNELVYMSLFAAWGLYFLWSAYREIVIFRESSRLEKEANSESDAKIQQHSLDTPESKTGQHPAASGSLESGGVEKLDKQPKKKIWLLLWGCGILLTCYWFKIVSREDLPASGTLLALIFLMPTLFFAAYFRFRGRSGFWGGVFGLFMSVPMLILGSIIVPPY